MIAIGMQRKIARQRATLDFIEKVESGEHYRKIVHTFTELRRGVGFAHLSNPQTDEDEKTRLCVNDYMNHYEMVAIGISAGILDEAIYRNWMRGPFVRDWNAAAQWIQRERWKRQEDGSWEYYEKIFENYGYWACRWSHEAVVLDEEFSGPPPDAEAEAPGAEPLPADSADQEGDSETGR
jgi:hypothetical protein